jgi:hypothetical protein
MMVRIVTKNARTGELTARELTDAEAIAIGLIETEAAKQARVEAKTDEAFTQSAEMQAILNVVVDGLIALRDGQLDGRTKEQIIAIARARYKAKLEEIEGLA